MFDTDTLMLSIYESLKRALSCNAVEHNTVSMCEADLDAQVTLTIRYSVLSNYIYVDITGVASKPNRELRRLLERIISTYCLMTILLTCMGKNPESYLMFQVNSKPMPKDTDTYLTTYRLPDIDTVLSMLRTSKPK